MARTFARGIRNTLMVAAVLTLTACVAPSPAPTPNGASEALEDGRSVEIAPGRTLWIECAGTGSPTVILESGIHDSSDPWAAAQVELQPPAVGPDVFTALSENTRVCRYDRPGTIIATGSPELTTRSSPVEMPRTIDSVANDLEALLAAAQIDPPYVLVGHSFGGFLQTYYAQTHPDEVVGLVLVDAFSAEMESLFGDQWDAYEKVLNSDGGSGLAADAAFERYDVSESDRLAHEAPPLDPELPVVVLSKTEAFPLPENVQGFTSADIEQVWQESQTRLAALVPRTVHIIAEGTDHYIQARQPDLVTSAVLLTLERARASLADGDR